MSLQQRHSGRGSHGTRHAHQFDPSAPVTHQDVGPKVFTRPLTRSWSSCASRRTWWILLAVASWSAFGAQWQAALRCRRGVRKIGRTSWRYTCAVAFQPPFPISEATGCHRWTVGRERSLSSKLAREEATPCRSTSVVHTHSDGVDNSVFRGLMMKNLNPMNPYESLKCYRFRFMTPAATMGVRLMTPARAMDSAGLSGITQTPARIVV